MPALTQINNLLNSNFNGVIKVGKHNNTGECCILELCSVIRNIPWTDDPKQVRCFDIRPLNDIKVSDALRTEYMAQLLVAYDGSLDWSKDKQKAVVTEIIIETVKQIIAELPGLTDEVREQCRKVKSLDEARVAANAAYDYDAYDYDAYDYDAYDVAYAADAEKREQIFVTACKI